MSIFSSTSITTWLNSLAVYTYQISLHNGDPLLGGGTEISGGSYVRQGTTFAVNSNTLYNVSKVTFTGLPAATVTHVAAWYTSGPNSGSMAFSAPLTESFTTTAGSTWTIDATEYVIFL